MFKHNSLSTTFYNYINMMVTVMLRTFSVHAQNNGSRARSLKSSYTLSLRPCTFNTFPQIIGFTTHYLYTRPTFQKETGKHSVLPLHYVVACQGPYQLALQLPLSPYSPFLDASSLPPHPQLSSRFQPSCLASAIHTPLI